MFYSHATNLGSFDEFLKKFAKLPKSNEIA